MGEFPEPAIRGSTFELSASVPSTSTSSSQPSRSIQVTTPFPSTSSFRVETKTSVAPIPLPTSKAATSLSSSIASSTSSSTTESSTLVQSTTSQVVTTSIQPTLTTQSTTSAPPPTSQVVTPLLVPSPITTTIQASRVQTSTIESIESETSSTGIVTRPIITPTPSAPPPLATTAPTANAHLSFGAIMGIVAIVIVFLVISGICIMFGPRRALRKLGIGRDEEKTDYEGWARESRTLESLGSDWRPFPTRPSTVSMGGPGMAGVGAGRGMDMDSGSHRRGAVRSGWFAASMVRGASLLSLGSLVRPPAEPMNRMGTGGSAGKRFQELYRRERAATRSNEPAEYLANVSELGERRSSGMDRTRSVPKVRRPSRLAMSYVPEIVVHDATLPNLSSVSSVTHESGRGYDADAEVERRPNVF